MRSGVTAAGRDVDRTRAARPCPPDHTSARPWQPLPGHFPPATRPGQRKDGDRCAHQAVPITRHQKSAISVLQSAWELRDLEFATTEHIVERAERIRVMTREPRSLDPAEHVRPVDNAFARLHMHFVFAVVVGHPNLT